MIVYADRQREADTAELVEAVRRAVSRLAEGETPQHEQSIELLVALGELETAVVDALTPDQDRETRTGRALRRAMHLSGRLVRATWDGDTPAARRAGQVITAAVAGLRRQPLPPRVRPRVPEGYVYYSLRPEMYLEAARQFLAEVRPQRAVCIGLRSIGTSLSAVVVAALAEAGCPARSFTVRPRGHPFSRALVLSPELEAELQAAVRGAHVLLVDEGPGLSGSSFTGAARRLSQMGVPDDRLVLFPSWRPDPDRFVSADARWRWRRHRSYQVPFEEVWLRSGRLAAAFSAAPLTDLSAGRWRTLLYDSPEQHPAVHPHHERRKYLSLVPTQGQARLQLLKFCGLGEYGRAALARAQALAAAGFGPTPRGLRHGFLALDFVTGRPLTPADATPSFLETAADYIGFVARHESSPEPVPLDPLQEMMRTNVAEGLGAEWVEALRTLEPSRRASEAGCAIAVDGRMLPHEWLATAHGHLKTDGVDHHDDHTFPGRQDVAWDVAGTAVEFELSPSAERAFVAACRERLGDPGLPQRLPFYRAAYLAYRLGYASFAVDSVDDDLDRARFARLRDRYGIELRGMLKGAVAAA